MNDEFYMNLAIDEAWKYQFLTYPNPAVGCVILDKNKQLLSIQAHKKAGLAHAELEAIKEALKKLNPNLDIPDEPNKAHEFILKNHSNLLKDGIAYVSLEPCSHQGKTPPCVELFTGLKFKKVFIAALDNTKAGGGFEILKNKGISKHSTLCEERAKDLLKPFYKWQRGEAFKLFKLALSLNGSALGKDISSKESRIYAHKIRSVIDLLVIGGRTMRMDRPILDARLVDGKAPNLCILSHKSLESFDKNISAFCIKGRNYYDHIPKDTKFMMFEGGENFLKSFKNDMDAFLIFSNSRFTAEKSLSLDLNFKAIYKGELGGDSYGIYELQK